MHVRLEQQWLKSLIDYAARTTGTPEHAQQAAPVDGGQQYALATRFYIDLLEVTPFRIRISLINEKVTVK